MHIIIQRVTITIHVHCTPHEALHFKKEHLKAINKNRSLPVKAIRTKQVQYTLSKFQFQGWGTGLGLGSGGRWRGLCGLALALGSLALRSVRTGIPHTRVLLHDGADSDELVLVSVGDLHGLLVHIDTIWLQKRKTEFGLQQARLTCIRFTKQFTHRDVVAIALLVVVVPTAHADGVVFLALERWEREKERKREREKERKRSR